MLNAGLLLRVLGEPWQRMGDWTALNDGILLVSAMLHIVAIGIVVFQIWVRVIPRSTNRERTQEPD